MHRSFVLDHMGFCCTLSILPYYPHWIEQSWDGEALLQGHRANQGHAPVCFQGCLDWRSMSTVAVIYDLSNVIVSIKGQLFPALILSLPLSSLLVKQLNHFLLEYRQRSGLFSCPYQLFCTELPVFPVWD